MNSHDLRFEAQLHQAPARETSQCDFAMFSCQSRYPLHLRREFYARGATTGLHLHRDFSAFYAVRGGRGVHFINGEAFAITRGDVYLLSPGAHHEYQKFAALEVDAFYFQSALWRDDELDALRHALDFWRLLEPPKAILDEKGHWRRAAPRFHLRPEAWRALETQITELREEKQRDEHASAVLLRGGFLRLLLFLARELQANRDAKTFGKVKNTTRNESSSLDAAIAEAIRLCDEEFALPWSLETLASRAFISPRHFASLFAQRTGVTPAVYLRNVRLERARALLRERRHSVGEVAHQSGWNSQAHFCRVFKATFGVSPRHMK